MKKLLPSVTLAFASLAAFTGTAGAWGTFGLFPHHCCCRGCGGTITLRQYNAFSPVACGSMVFQGCVTQPAPGPGDGFGYGGFNGDCGDSSCAPGTPVGHLPANVPGATYGYPPAAYTYGPAMPMQQMPAVAYPAAPVQGAVPASARVP